MIPALPSLEGWSPTEVPPPPSFRELSGTPERVTLRRNEYRRAVGLSLAQKTGLYFEESAQEFLLEKLGITYYAASTLEFIDGSAGVRRLHPDGVFLHRDSHITVFEIKVQHMPEAWWQLRRLYQPVLRELPPRRWVNVVEVVRSFDPSMSFPEPVERIVDADLVEWISQPRGELGVFQWHPRR